jgi:2'-5' RNA ligase superfamily
MPTHGQTGLVIPVPAADAVLAAVGARYPGTVREGVPAHVSLLYPFVAAAELDERVTSALGELLAEQAPMPVQFAECYCREGFVALCPDPIDGLKELMSKAHRRWPDVVAYEGVPGRWHVVSPPVQGSADIGGFDGGRATPAGESGGGTGLGRCGRPGDGQGV